MYRIFFPPSTVKIGQKDNFLLYNLHLMHLPNCTYTRKLSPGDTEGKNILFFYTLYSEKESGRLKKEACHLLSDICLPISEANGATST